ncbi:flavin reductase [Salinibacterium sp. ZJ454]|uniref:flavin reductase n=1 Tax=Salinibacterium sp. ZJ454 TaxID=2708339 RepID=UPI001421EEC0|nr:flavin reductase [Salinibacterium sp. ZJ454]
MGESGAGVSPRNGADFREVLGHYPTGVAVVTAIVDEAPVGMVIGSFTSASLDPALVAFLPSRSSATYRKLRRARSFVINVLSADQEGLCRRLSSKEDDESKWSGLGWSPGLSGAPLLDGAVAYVECAFEHSYDAGDHDIVLGKVTDLKVGSGTLPLLFFQGGYGRFASTSLVIPSELDMLGPATMANHARPILEQLSGLFGRDCVAIVKIRNHLVTVASSAGRSGQGLPRYVGRRIPHVPPMGGLFVAWEGDEAIEAWVAGASTRGAANPKLGEMLKDGLERVRVRGYSLALDSPMIGAVEHASDRFRDGQFTPVEERSFRNLLDDLTQAYAELYEPARLPSGRDYQVRLISVPVFGGDGHVEMVLQLWDLADADSELIAECVEALKAAARQLSELLQVERHAGFDSAHDVVEPLGRGSTT